jgi:hypothetical protein
MNDGPLNDGPTNDGPTNGQGALAGLSPDELRAAVREVLREVLPSQAPEPSLTHGEVVIATDTDLTAFLRRVAALCEDPQQRAMFQDGRHGFRLGRPGGPGPVGTGTPVTRVDRGAVTERAVVRAAADGARLVLGPGAVLTPLARDKARSLGVEIERER